jgi:hypothetical protein
MRVDNYTCDICGKSISNSSDKLTLRHKVRGEKIGIKFLIPKYDDTYNQQIYSSHVDICRECQISLLKMAIKQTEGLIPEESDVTITRNETMASQIMATIKSADTSYRDRVDMIAAAYILGLHANPRLCSHVDGINVAAWAINQIDAIDKAIAEREGRECLHT